MPRNHERQTESSELPVSATPPPSGLAIRVIDSVHGRPAEGITGRLRSQREGLWQESVPIVIGSNGSLSTDALKHEQRYLIELEIGAYYAEFGFNSILARVAITFVTPEQGSKLEIMIALTRTAFTLTANLGE